MQTEKVFGVQDRRSTAPAKLPWVVRYAIDGGWYRDAEQMPDRGALLFVEAFRVDPQFAAFLRPEAGESRR